MKNKLKSITKAFVLIVIPALLTIGGIFAVVPVAQMAMGGISHPLMAFPALILMIPWGLMFVVIFFLGVGTMRTAFDLPTIALFAPIPSFVIYSHGNGGYSVTSGKGRGGGIILAIIKFVIAIPLAILVWIIVSIIILFSSKMENRINNAFEEFIGNLKRWYKWGALIFVVFPLIVVGFNAIENAIYSPKNIEIRCADFYYDKTWEHQSPNTNECQTIDNYYFEYTINPNGKDITEIKGEWEFTNKETGESFSLDADTFVPYNWHWRSEDKNTAHSFNTIVSIPQENSQQIETLSNDFEDIKITCKIDYISFKSNIPILGDFLFPTIDNEFKNGYEILVKP